VDEVSQRVETIERGILTRRLIRAMKKKVNTEKKELLRNQHGVSRGDYDRCRRNNGVACAPCRAIAAAYMREKNKDPKYKATEREYYKKNPHKRPPNNRDRARNRGNKRSYYTRQQIFDRDGYDCYLCGTPVDLTAPHNMKDPGWETYPHVEHVIPLSLGGDDTLENVKIAHAKCNLAKGTAISATA